MFYNCSEVMKMSKVINPNLPEEYKYETDYRKIPREYLNPRIPKGRGFVKWQPFKTIPEQYEILENYIKEQDKVDMPILTEEHMQLINDTVAYKLKYNVVSEVTYWENGENISVSCYINKVDKLKGIMWINLVDENAEKYIYIRHIIDVQ